LPAACRIKKITFKGGKITDADLDEVSPAIIYKDDIATQRSLKLLLLI